jgi:hypothetical protein
MGTLRTYSIDEANALVREVRAVLLQIALEQRRLATAHEEMHRNLEGDGDPAAMERAGRHESEMTEIAEGIRTLESHLAGLGVQLRDLEMGLVDFPAERDGRRVWLCWRLSDPQVAFWHGTDEGYPSRKPW